VNIMMTELVNELLVTGSIGAKSGNTKAHSDDMHNKLQKLCDLIACIRKASSGESQCEEGENQSNCQERQGSLSTLTSAFVAKSIMGVTAGQMLNNLRGAKLNCSRMEANVNSFIGSKKVDPISVLQSREMV